MSRECICLRLLYDFPLLMSCLLSMGMLGISIELPINHCSDCIAHGTTRISPDSLGLDILIGVLIPGPKNCSSFCIMWSLSACAI
jgi:hypothetical protein